LRGQIDHRHSVIAGGGFFFTVDLAMRHLSRGKATGFAKGSTHPCAAQPDMPAVGRGHARRTFAAIS
jgi:hypothetical protein